MGLKYHAKLVYLWGYTTCLWGEASLCEGMLWWSY